MTRSTKMIISVGLVVLMFVIPSCKKESKSRHAEETTSKLKILGVPDEESTKPGRFKRGTEPDGFRKIKWGTKHSLLSARGIVTTIPHSVFLSWTTYGYDEKSDEYPFYYSNIGGARVGRPVYPMIGIDFLFYEEKFGGVLAYPYDFENFMAIKVFLFLKFGPSGTGSIDSAEFFWKVPCTCVWEGRNTVIMLSHDGNSQGRFYMYEKKLHKLVMAEEKEKQRQKKLKIREQFRKWKERIRKKAEQGLLQEKRW